MAARVSAGGKKRELAITVHMQPEVLEIDVERTEGGSESRGGERNEERR